MNDPEDIDEVIEHVKETLHDQEEIDGKQDEVANVIEADNEDENEDVDKDVDRDVDGDVSKDVVEEVEEVDTGIETQRQGFNAQYYFISTFDD